MYLAINDNLISIPGTPHTATRYGGEWVVSWLPGSALQGGGLSKEQAISAMWLAFQISQDASMHGEHWPEIAAGAAELGLTGPEAVSLCEVAPRAG